MKHEDNTKETLTDKSQASNEALRLYAALVRQLYKHAPIGIVATIANSFILTFILWNVIPHSILISWLSATVSISFFRYLSLCKYWRSSPTSAEACRWATWFIIGIALSGIVWGFAGIFLFSVDSIAHQVFLAFVIGGMVAAAAGTFSIIMKAFLAYSLPALAPIIMRFFVIGDNIHLAMGAMTLLFGLLMFFTAKRISAVIVFSLKLQFERSDLINHLAAEKERIEKLNESLNSEVTERKRAEEETRNTLTELQEMQDMLVQSGKLAAIGRLTAGVTHEILNPVNIISMKLQLLEMTGRLPPETMTEIDICKAQLERIIHITKDLSHFSRIPEKQTHMEDLNNVIENVLALCTPQFKIENIKTDVRCQPNLPMVLLDRERIEQVILNIISNAVAAMKDQERKIIKIITKAEPSLKSPEHIRLIISDTGTGIKNENLYRLFDPFFTTKNAGEGTGLGLFISYGIIQDHGGKFWAENNKSEGASFIIEFPIVKDHDN